jgi:hypothetical protein
MNSVQEQIIENIKDLKVDCPECECMEDEQYTCTTCWHEGGNWQD